MKAVIGRLVTLYLFIVSGYALAGESGLKADAWHELRAAGVDKYLGTSQSVASDYGVWTKHDFNPNYVPDETYPSGLRCGFNRSTQHTGRSVRPVFHSLGSFSAAR